MREAGGLLAHKEHLDRGDALAKVLVLLFRVLCGVSSQTPEGFGDETKCTEEPRKKATLPRRIQGQKAWAFYEPIAASNGAFALIAAGTTAVHGRVNIEVCLQSGERLSLVMLNQLEIHQSPRASVLLLPALFYPVLFFFFFASPLLVHDHFFLLHLTMIDQPQQLDHW